MFVLQRFGAQRLERVAQRGFGVLVRLEALGVDGAIPFELGEETRLRRTGREPADERADGEADHQRDDQESGFDGH